MPQTISQAMIDGTLGDLTQPPAEPLPWYADMGESIPTLTASAGTKAFRGSGTILRGGSGANIGKGAWFREGVRQANYARPRNWMQFGTQDYFHHTGALNVPRQGAPGRHTTYNPFYGAAGVNWAGRKMAGEGTGRVGQALSKTGFAKSMVEKGYVGGGRELVSKGFYSRVGAAGRIGWMSNKQFGRATASTSQFLQGAGYAPWRAQRITDMGRTATRQAILTSGTGTLSGRIGGFMAGSMGQIPFPIKLTEHARKGANLATAWTAQTGKGAAAAALKKTGKGAAAKVVGKSVALTGARLAGLAVPGLNVAMAAWLVYDLAKLTTKGAGHAAQLGVDGFKSFRGGMNVGIMEQGFTDTEATMTSRARGVQAISNSRLNARGVLGSEAGAMHSHFG